MEVFFPQKRSKKEVIKKLELTKKNLMPRPIWFPNEFYFNGHATLYIVPC